VRAAWIAIPLLAILCALMIAVPSLLDPLCGDWSGAEPFRWARRAARAAHAAVFSEFPVKPHPHPRDHR
jgi:hypothetical protein